MVAVESQERASFWIYLAGTWEGRAKRRKTWENGDLMWFNGGLMMVNDG